MSSAPTLEDRLRSAPPEELIRTLTALAAEDPDCSRDPAFIRRGAALLIQVCRGEAAALEELWGRFLAIDGRLRTLAAQNRELIAFIKNLDKRPTLGWILSPPFALNGEGRRFLYASPLGPDVAPQCYEIVEGDEHVAVEIPPPPFLGFIEPASRLFFRPATNVPPAPLRAEILQVIAARPESKFEAMGEIEVSEGPEDRKRTVLAERALAAEVKRLLDEDGESVSVRVEMGVATGIHQAADRQREDWLEFPELEGPTMKDLVFPRWLSRQWARDIKRMVGGASVKVLLLGPTGTGKSSAAEYCGRDMCQLAAKKGVPRKGFALIRLSGPHIGSSYIHQVERNMFRALTRAESLVRKGYFVIILADEADALLGEIEGGLEHSHNRSERLAAQELLGRDLPGIAIYLTMNARRTSWLPAAIARRFSRREYPRATRSQIADVATRYVNEHPQLLRALGMAADEFGAAFSMNLFSEHRIVAVGHLHSGADVVVRARDLQTASPGKAKELIEAFAFDIDEGEAKGLEDLWTILDREFRACDLTVHNFTELTFLDLPRSDALRAVEICR